MNGFGLGFKGGSFMIGSFIGFLFGDSSPLLSIIIALVIIDYLTGLTSAYIEGKLSSRVGFKGIGKKVMVFAMIAVASLIDTALGNPNVIRDATIFFYISNEVISIIENAGRAGVPIPEKLKQAIELLKMGKDKDGENSK